VLNLLDVHAVRPMSGHAVYCMAKAGLQMMTLAMAKDLGPQIRVNGVAPGAILWPEQDSTSEDQQKILNKTVMGRAGKPEDIASAVAYLGLQDRPSPKGALRWLMRLPWSAALTSWPFIRQVTCPWMGLRRFNWQ